jgi:nicotinamide-nucleotide amidase
MRAAVLAVGNELLGSDRVDTNSLMLASALESFGVELGAKAVVGDDISAIREMAGRLLERHELLLVTGGLGPTRDDLTREALAELAERPLVRSEEVLKELERKFASFGYRMPVVNEKQADVIEGATVLENQRGTAPGLMAEHRGRTLFAFPGVPFELEGLVESALVPWLAERATGEGMETATFKVACVPESRIEEDLQPFYEQWGNDGVALLPTSGEVIIRLTARGAPDERSRWLDPRRESLGSVLAGSVFTEDAAGTLEGVTGKLLAESGLTIGTAESCTGGLIAERLTRVAGSSGFFLGSVVAYANDVKSEVLQVGVPLLEQHGAVSENVAVAMAIGLRGLIGVDVAVAVTGVAGPDGGTEEKPVGTVHLALCGPSPDEVRHRRLRLPGDRERVRWMSSQWALEMVRRRILESRPANG